MRKRIVNSICTFYFLILSVYCSAQTYLHDPITQLKNNSEFALYPFAGGVNNPQFNTLDFTNDGIK
ncbi:MAG: hypothetical protein H7Y00_00565, partial [Fimbriimonadaceae bacterium]|nr:hypothetical protein [Chitinophagales bacterium]